MTRSERRFAGRAPARPEELAPLRTAIWRHAQAIGATPEVANDIRLAVGEALMNVVMHAYLGMEPGPMIVEACFDDGQLTIQVLDDGRGLLPRVDSPGLGVGLGVIAQVADDFRIANREGRPGTIVSLRFSLAGSRATTGC
jgi:serine/threonine-protein kinase RsbW